MSNPPTPEAVNAAMLAELSRISGQLGALQALITQNHESSNRRIDDLRHALEQRLDGVDERVGELEKNERKTALKVAGISAISSAATSAIVSLAFAALRGGNH